MMCCYDRLHLGTSHLTRPSPSASAQLYFEIVNPGEEVSVEYGFTPNPLLTPTEFTVALTLFYEDTKGEFFSTTFFNSTIDIVEKPKLIDTDLIFMTLTLAAIFTAIGELLPGNMAVAHDMLWHARSLATAGFHLLRCSHCMQQLQPGTDTSRGHALSTSCGSL